ncbi:MAG: hypothetical protein GY865_11540, partial [candidate division Zixibacteria bacterium]|nr:hypothetical protein [candidate division Zixibacteria bacterium]
MMTPFKKTFDNAKSYDKYANICLWLSLIIMILPFVIQYINKDWKFISEIINAINCFFILSYAIFQLITDNISYEASTQKRIDFIDNSFETSFSEENSNGYYSNDDIEKGVYKMAINGFENSLFTYNIAKRMIKPLWMKNAIIGMLFAFLAIEGYNNAFIMLLQLSLPLLLLNQAIKHTLFVTRINKVYENYRRLFQDLKNNTNKEVKKPEIIINV